MRERAAAMRQRVSDRAARELLSFGELAAIDAAVGSTLALRDALLEDDHDIDALHPARSVLILLDDAAVRDAQLLAVAAHLESVRPELRVQPATPALQLMLSRIATPPDCPPDELLERLVDLEADLLDVALAERLDHARHLHLRDRTAWAGGLALEEAVYLPLARRRGGLIGRRYDRWHRAFRARAGRSG